MTDYAKIALDAVLSENTDYSDPRMKLETTQTLTPTVFLSQKINALTTGATTIDLSPTSFSSIDLIIIQNLDTTNYVTFSWLGFPNVTTAIANPGSTGFTFTASDDSITDNTSGSAFTNVQAGHFLHNNNATDSSNRGNMHVKRKVSAHKVEVSSGLTDSSNDTAVSFTLNRYNEQRIAAGGILTIPGNVFVDTATSNFNEMQITANTATVACNLMIFGS